MSGGWVIGKKACATMCLAWATTHALIYIKGGQVKRGGEDTKQLEFREQRKHEGGRGGNNEGAGDSQRVVMPPAVRRARP